MSEDGQNRPAQAQNRPGLVLEFTAASKKRRLEQGVADATDADAAKDAKIKEMEMKLASLDDLVDRLTRELKKKKRD